MFYVLNIFSRTSNYCCSEFATLIVTSALALGCAIPNNAVAQGQEGFPADLSRQSAEPNVIDGNALNDLLREYIRRNFLAAAPTQIITTSTGRVASGLNQQLAAFALQDDGADVLAAAGPGIINSPGSALSLFLISGAQFISHDGYDISPASGGDGRTATFDETDYGLTLGMRFDASEYIGLSKHSATMGFFANYTHSDIDLGTTPALAASFSSIGEGDVDSWSLGTYGLFTSGSNYGLVTLTGTFGAAETENAVFSSTADFNTFGLSASAMVGRLIDLGEAKLDLRGGLIYVHADGDNHSDSAGNRFRDARLEDFSGTASARLFTNITGEDYRLKPFVQAGVTQRFHYDNEVTVNGEEFSFDDADTTLFGRLGVDFNLSDQTQAYVAVRGDINEDVEAIAAQIGMTVKLD